MAKAFSNFFYYFLDFAVISVFNYIFWILLGKMLSPEQYGILFTITSLFYIISIFTTAGLQEPAARFISIYPDKTSSIIKYCIKKVFILSLFSSVVIFLFAGEISSVFYGSPVMADPMRALSILLFSGSFLLIFKGVLQGLERFKAMFIGDLAGNTIKIIVAFILVSYGMQAVGGIIAVTAWFFIASLIFLFSMRDKLFNRGESFDRPEFRKYYLASTVSLFCLFFLQRAPIILLSVMSGLEDAALLGAMFVIGQIVLFVPSVIYGPILPILSKSWESDKTRFSLVFTRSVKIITATVLPMIIAISFFSETIMEMFFTAEYVSASPMLLLYLLSLLIYGINMVILISLYAAKMPGPRMISLLIGCATLLLASVFLIPVYGVSGAVYALIGSQIIILALGLYQLNKIINHKISKETYYLIPLLLGLYLVNVAGASFGLLPVSLIASTILYPTFLLKLKIINEKDISVFRVFRK